MAKLVIFNKPYQVLSQFTDKEGRKTLAEYIQFNNVYSIGRLDYDSEGLLLLTDSGYLKNQIAHPRNKQPKTYWVQVEGSISDNALQQLRNGIELNDGPTLPAKARRINTPVIPNRDPPVRTRKNITDSWLELTITEGRNRQVRRMTAAVGFPTLRLYRYRVGDWNLDQLSPGEFHVININVPEGGRPAKPDYRTGIRPNKATRKNHSKFKRH
ncbi:MAG: pseudouridine synthase [Pseudomonadales bacterium]|nr:pseudouridine synthase [Pseudomonadales bacterium]